MANNHIATSGRYLLCLCIIALIASFLVGCSAPGLTSEEVHRRHVDTWKTQMLQMQDDVDDFWMIDRPSRLSDKYTR